MLRAVTGCFASARLAWPALQRLRVVGGDAAGVLAQLQLTEAELRDPDFRIPEEMLDDLWIACRDAARDEAFGLHAGLDPALGQFGVVEYVIRNSATLGEAMEAGMRFQRVLHDAGADRIDVEDDRATIVVALSSGREPAGPLVDYGFARAMVSGMLLTGAPGRPIEMRFVHAKPREVSQWERTFHCPLVFGASENAMVIRRDRLDARIVGSDAGLLPILEKHALELLARIPETTSFVKRVNELVMAELSGGTPSVERIASKLRMSERTLSRRLADEGTSFTTLLDDLRRELAIGHLRDRELSVSEVAFLLGFTDSNSFSRAFKRWTGQPPSSVKRPRAEAG